MSNLRPFVQVFAFSLVLGLLLSNGVAAKINSPANNLEVIMEEEPGDKGGRNLGLGMGNVGCTFSNAVCDPKLEFCYNDNAFGRCLPQFGTPTESSLYRYSLSKSDMHLLEGEIERLFNQGYRWGHSYTQCLLQNILNALRHGLDLEKSAAECTEMGDEDQDLRNDKFGGEEVNPLDLAFIKFSPQDTLADETHQDFANEVYAPSNQGENEGDGLSALDELKAMENPRLSLEEESILDALLQNYMLDELGRPRPENVKKSLDKELGRPSEQWEDYALGDDEVGLRVNEKIIQPRVFSTLYNTPEMFRNGLETRDAIAFNDERPNLDSLTKANPDEVEEIPLEFLEMKDRDDVNDDDVKEIVREVEEALVNDAVAEEMAAAAKEREPRRDDSGLYTEGGLVFLNNPKRFFFQGDGEDGGGGPGGDDEDLEVGYEGGGSWDNRNGFERRERLDVKKPGPWYRTVNNFAFDYEEQQEKDNDWVAPSQFNPELGGIGPAELMRSQKLLRTNLKHNVPVSSNIQVDNQPNEIHHQNGQTEELMDLMTKKASAPAIQPIRETVIEKSPGDDQGLDIIDTSYVNVVVSNKIGGWNGAKDLVNLLADLMDLKRSVFNEVRQTGDVVTFKIEPNDKKWNSTQVARKIETLSAEVEKESGVRIVKARVGVRTNASSKSVEISRRSDFEDGNDFISKRKYPNSSLGSKDPPSNLPAQLPLYADSTNNNLYVATFATCGIVAAILVAAFVIFFIRKNAKSKEKFARLAQDDPNMEACRDYQDLCRARMASKNNEKMEPMRAVQRVQSHASRESEGGTSSSRSSTSSWTEEPVHTNMDISTGHMVLNSHNIDLVVSYMEDHLKNKDRLDQEWAALCAYEADPGSTSIAEKPENAKSNRYSNSLPFDHSRVILNDLANITGSDYINASTITDHDPRNPAYIATQGPLATTSADFWQMVWEQGSVVIVSLTRLSDNGTSLCHRYWPEEGSELLHIYEVHLVSEHIWCEEYLVRSFYLKNVKTGETRTVTQFQFLAWPENGVPSSTKALLEFRRKVNKSYRGRSCPIIVHCSDGAGRTGTYCLIDMVLNRMRKGAKEIDIAASLEHIRDQRPGMVRTKQQFEFVLMAVAEEVHAILKALPQ